MGLVFLELRRVRRASPDAIARLDARVQSFADQLGARIGESAATSRELTGLVGTRLDTANQTFQQITERLGRLEEATRQVERVGRSISELEQILASPKRRGGLGEWSLELLLDEALPAGQVARQHRLPSRDVIVDVAIRAPDDRWLAIDSKFPLEAYRRVLKADLDGVDAEAARRELQRAVRGRVEEIASKYISPEDGTLDFALMYIPSEGVYYELAVRESGGAFLEYCRSRRVYPCSPNTLYVYLQALVMGLRGQRIADETKLIQATLEHLRQEIGGAATLLERAATQQRNALQNVEAATSAVATIGDRLERVAGPERLEPSAPSERLP